MSRPWMLFEKSIQQKKNIYSKFGFQKCSNKNIIFSNIFFFKCSNLHERSGISWIKRKIIFEIFTVFIFRVMVIFWSLFVFELPQFSINFHDNLTNKNRKNWFFIHFSILHIIHENRIKTDPICISLDGNVPIICLCTIFLLVPITKLSNAIEWLRILINA